MLTEEGAKQGAQQIERIFTHVYEVLLAIELLGKSPEEQEQFTHTLWASAHSFTLFHKRDRIQPAHLQTQNLMPIAQKRLFMGWALQEEVIQKARLLLKQFKAESL